MANTNILIKRSAVGGLGKPTSLLAGELAYSYASNTIFIGSPTGNGVINVGGQYYTSTLDDATSSNTAGTLVKRDVNGQFSGRLDGIAGKADILTNARNFSISGGDITATTQSFDGSAAIILGLYALAYIIFTIFVSIGIWRSAGFYVIEKNKKKENGFWGYAARVSVVLAIIRFFVEIIKDLK